MNLKIIVECEGRKVYQKCPECGSTEMSSKITCAKCGYEYFLWDIEEINEEIKE